MVDAEEVPTSEHLETEPPRTAGQRARELFGVAPPGRAAAVNLNPDALATLVDGVVASVRGGGDAGSWSLSECVELASVFLRRIYPAGVWVRRAADDALVGVGARPREVGNAVPPEARVGVAGVRAGLIAGPGWARVGDRGALWRAFTDLDVGATVGATVVLLESHGDERTGHARAWHRTADGPRGVDPQRPVDRVYEIDEIDAGRDPDKPVALQLWPDAPDRRAGIVEIWAVLINGEGRVIDPHGQPWAQPESASTASALLDAATNHTFGKWGEEEENHAVVLGRGEEFLGLPCGESLLRTADGLVKVVSDGVNYFLTPDGNIYGRFDDVPHHIPQDKVVRIRYSVPEIVTAPWVVLGGEDGAQRQEVEQHKRTIRDILNGGAGRTIAELFNDPNAYVVSAEYRDVRVATTMPIFEKGDYLYVQATVGIPLNAMAAVLDVVAEQSAASVRPDLRPNQSAAQRLLSLSRWVGAEVTRWYSSPQIHDIDDVPMLADLDSDIGTIFGTVYLASQQVAAIPYWFGNQIGLIKWNMAAASRTSLEAIRVALPTRVQQFFQEHCDKIEDTLADVLLQTFPGLAELINEPGNAPGHPRRLLNVILPTERGGGFSAGHYFNQLLLGGTLGITPKDMFGIGGPHGLDRLRTLPYQPEVLVELRYLGAITTTPEAYEWVREQVLAAVQRADRVSLFTATLAETDVGQAVVNAVKAAAALPPAQRTDHLPGIRAAVANYLHAFPTRRAQLVESLAAAESRLGQRLVPPPTDEMTRYLVDELNRAADPAPASDPRLGPDLFGLRLARPRPPVLRNVVQKELTTGEIGGLVDRLDMARMPSSGGHDIWSGPPQRPEWWAPAVPAVFIDPRNPLRIVRLQQVQEMPLLKHFIWLGGPFTRTDFLANVAATAQLLRPRGWQTVLWTDVPRSAFDTVHATKLRAESVPAEFNDVAAMLEWAQENGVRLVNVNEVFHAEEPMGLNDYYRSEMAKQIPRGYAAAADILRLEILSRFGGLYSDVDNRMYSLNGVRELFDEIGLAVQYTDDYATGQHSVSSSVLLAARNHPFISLYLRAIKSRYTLAHDSLIGSEIVDASPEAFGDEVKHMRRNSIIWRTGPNVQMDLMTYCGYKAPYRLPHFTRDVFTLESAQSWISTRPLAPTRRTAPEDVPRTLQGVITTTYRDLTYRKGRAHATSYASVINSLPDPAAGWRAWAEFLLAQGRVRENWKGITLGIKHPGIYNAVIESWVNLPEEVCDLLGIPAGGGAGVWQVGEYHIPVNTGEMPHGHTQRSAEDQHLVDLVNERMTRYDRQGAASLILTVRNTQDPAWRASDLRRQAGRIANILLSGEPGGLRGGSEDREGWLVEQVGGSGPEAGSSTGPGTLSLPPSAASQQVPTVADLETTPTIHEGARALSPFGDVRAAGGPMAALAAWVAAKEAEHTGKITDPAADCVVRAAEAFQAMHGRLNHPIDAALVNNPTVHDLLHALGGTLTAVGRPETIGEAVASRPGSAALVVTQPPADRAHVYWLVADDSGGDATLRWVDTQRPGTFAEPARITSDNPNWWARQLDSARVLLFDPAGQPTTVDALLNARAPSSASRESTTREEARTRTSIDRTVEAVLDPSTGPRRHGALPPTVIDQIGASSTGSVSTVPPPHSVGPDRHVWVDDNSTSAGPATSDSTAAAPWLADGSKPDTGGAAEPSRGGAGTPADEPPAPPSQPDTTPAPEPVLTISPPLAESATSPRVHQPADTVAATTGPEGTDLLDGLRAAVRPATPTEADKWLGPDLFGTRQAPALPPELPMVDPDQLRTAQLVPLFEAFDLVNAEPPRPDLGSAGLLRLDETTWIAEDHWYDRVVDISEGAAGLDPELRWMTQPLEKWFNGLEEHGGSAKMPRVIHSIWLGGPLRLEETGHLRDNLARMASVARDQHVWVLLWTDVTRAEFDAARLRPTRHPAVAGMLRWAKQNGIVLLNVDEFFHADKPMRLDPYYRMERDKQLPHGYAAASDILRAELLYRFGGVYSDPDNDILTLDGLDDLLRGPGFAVHDPDRGGVGNSALLAARWHPFPDYLLERLAWNYRRDQAALYDDRPGYDGTTQEESQDLLSSDERRLRRYSIMMRTGPYNLTAVFDALEYERGADAAYQYVPRIQQFAMGSDNSWVPAGSPLLPSRRYPAKQAVVVLAKAAATLIRELRNRRGDLHLTLVAPVINGLPEPDAAWHALLTFLLERPEIAGEIATVTHRVMDLAD
ncbi:MAG TPA: TcdA/TcdB catalytic glycosyltransferase domain-containing protein, partial [Pseudonocardiaceae bacterium]|nr:TcdA/TcdB catalytic glycosyltransferase domain-containing protein [Pseudonocardiaceae bacterium]